MKKITFLALLSVLTLSSIAQNKFGYINANEIVSLMPEYKKAGDEIANFTKSLEAQLGSMTAEFQQMQQEFKNNEETYNDLVKQDKQTEIEGLYNRIQDFQQNAQQSVKAKEQELLIPITEKAKKAIDDVATEGNYTYIFDSSYGTILYAKEGENVIDLVKKKLGL